MKLIHVIGILIVICATFSAPPAAAQVTYPEEVGALRATHDSLLDPSKNLANWRKGDPCTSNWTGVICHFNSGDGYLHVNELRLMKMNLFGTLAPELGKLSHLTILNFMWNNISGSIPKQIGDIKRLEHLHLSGNQISGSLADELGNLPNLVYFQIDFNNISGPLPRSFANLTSAKHFHMNNNSISGRIPSEISTLPNLLHILLDNNNLSGPLPPELSKMPNITVIQLDNNNLGGSEIPDSYASIPTLLKLSLRNCNLRGVVPDFSQIPKLMYLDLSQNELSGEIPTNQLSDNVTTIDLSNNKLGGSIPSNFSGFTRLQKLSLGDNSLIGTVSTGIWQNRNFSTDAKLILDFRNNLLTNISGTFDPPSNVSISLEGNPVCENANELNISKICGNSTVSHEAPPSSIGKDDNCQTHTCQLDDNFAFVPNFTAGCFCAAPFGIGFLLRSPSISDFPPYTSIFSRWIAKNLGINPYQLHVDSIMWQEGPRLAMFLKLFPTYPSGVFNKSELQRIVDNFATSTIQLSDTFGPYSLLNFTLLGPYKDAVTLPKSGVSKGALAGIIVGAFFAAVTVAFVAVIFLKRFYRRHKRMDKTSVQQQFSSLPFKLEGVREFGFDELKTATNNFDVNTQIGQGGYGGVYKGTLTDGTVAAIKRAQSGSLQGKTEFFTEIAFLSRLHHRNLVSLLGYCAEQGEQILVYEYMPNGSLHDVITARFKAAPSFATRLHIALGAAKGILYLHTEADPPIIHRDIKPNNILLDSKFNAKVADFGISRLAPTADGTEVMPTHVTTVVKGTPGYVDPEYFQTYQLTEKSDVYSLGIVFLELLTGMQSISHGRHIVQKVVEACQHGKMFSIINQSMGPYPADCVKKFMTLALRCVEEKMLERATMLEVVRELENITAMLPPAEQYDVSLTMSSDPDASTASRTSNRNSPILPVYTDRSMNLTSSDYGSDLVSGVVPSIDPR